MFFLLFGVMLGIYFGQEYKEIPNMKILIHKASSALRDAVRGENDDEGDLNKNQ